MPGLSNRTIYKILTFCMAAVWIANGLFCKMLNFVPRHEQIVRRILGSQSSRLFTFIIGLLEICMALWILSGYKTKQNAVAQILIVALMNIIEFFRAPDLLLWGKANAFFAFLFILVVYINEFHFKRKQN